MAYDGKIMRRALQQFEEDRRAREDRLEARRESVFRRQPRLREIENELRSTMSRIIASALRHGTDPAPAVEVLREGGFSAVNARSVAKKLGCSTQPIYSSFQNMDELKAALRARAIALHTQRVQDSLRAHEGNGTRYSSYGMGFVKFAAEEKQLFRWLYLEGGQMEPYQNDILLPEVLRAMEDEFGYPEEVARRFHQDMIYYSYGLAILANTDHLHLTESELREAFRREFRALIAIHGKPAKLPEFAVKAGVVL